MNNEKNKGNMGLMIVCVLTIVVIITFILSLTMTLEEKGDPQAQLVEQQKWAQNNLFVNSLQRYTNVYQKLNSKADKEALAVRYVELITNDLLMFPSKNGASISVILPEQLQDNTTVMQFKEIGLGTIDNGLFKAFRAILNPKPISIATEPPNYSSEYEQLLNYVINGEGNVDILVKMVNQ